MFSTWKVFNTHCSKIVQNIHFIHKSLHVLECHMQWLIFLNSNNYKLKSISLKLSVLVMIFKEGNKSTLTSSSRAQSATVFVIGPTWSIVMSIEPQPVYGTSPYVGFSPTSPHQDAGVLIDPPWSVPSAMSTIARLTYKILYVRMIH